MTTAATSDTSLELSTVMAGLMDGLTVQDSEGRFLQVSPSFERLVGFPAADLLGTSPYERGMFHPEDVDGVVEAHLASLERGGSERALYRLRRADGVFVWVESAGGTVETSDGPRIITVTREASHLESLAQGVTHERQLKLQLDELVARQRHFLTSVSHRARTPLTTVVGVTELLRRHRGEMDAETHETLLDRLAANSDQLVQLLAEVTEADRLTRDDVVLERRVVNVGRLVAEVVADVTADGGSVTVDIPAELRAVVDRDKVARVLRILISNALKYAGIGAAVTVAARQTPEGTELVVEDDGPGVPVEVRTRIFEPFVNGHPDLADPGSGLGLYIVSELAGLHRGRVWVTDRVGGGARFHVSLPKPRGDSQPGGRPTDDRADSASSALSPEAARFVTQVLQTLVGQVGMDIAYLSILDDTHQHILATAGEPTAGIEPGLRVPLENTYCARMIAGELNRVTPDTGAEPVVADLPGTADGLGCYIGIPVYLPSGQVLGSLCCASSQPDPTLTQAAADELRNYARILGDQLAHEGFVDGTVFDATGRIADVLTTSDCITTVFQPIVGLADGDLIGFEALTRFTGSDRPVELWFTDAARAGLLVELELETARRALDRLDELPPDAYLSINISPQTVLGPRLGSLLDQHPLHRIVLEITEHAAVSSYEPVRAALERHRHAGLRIAIDDVGTGYAGLGHLVQLQPDIIKVDRSLVETLDTEPTSARTIAVEALARMADHLDADLVAEGIERSATLGAIRRAGFTHAQGYLLGRPSQHVDADAIQAHVAGLSVADDRVAAA